MKKATKTLLLMLCAVVLVVSSILGTVAYLTSEATVENTFTVGKVEITLTEAKLDVQTGKKLTGEAAADVTGMQEIELVPGRVIEKNPVIKVADDSEECYLFVKVENGLTSVGTINWAGSKWKPVDGTQFWKYTDKVSAGTPVPVFESFTCKDDITKYDNGVNGSALNITAYAVQAENLSLDEAYAVINP